MQTSAFFVGVSLRSGTMAVVERNGWTHPESDPMTWSFHPRPMFRLRAAEHFAPETSAASLLNLATDLARRNGQAPVRVFVDVSGSSPRACEFKALERAGVVVIPQDGTQALREHGRLICPGHLKQSLDALSAARLAQVLA